MLKNILIGLGVFVATLPYLGFPSWIDTTLFTLAGLTIIFLLTVFQKRRIHHEVSEKRNEAPDLEEEPRTLYVKRREVEDHPNFHVEKETTLDTEHTEESSGLDTAVEKKVATVRPPERDRSQSGPRKKKDADKPISGSKP